MRATAVFLRSQLSRDYIHVVVSALMLAVGISILYHLVQGTDFAEVMQAALEVPIANLSVAALLIAMSYFTLTFYDFFALRTLQKDNIPYRIAAQTGVLSYTIGHNIGLTVLTAGAVRFRIYRDWGLTLVDIGKIAFLTGLTFWLGNGVVLAAGIAYAPEIASAVNKLPPQVNSALAIGVLAIILAYILWLMPRRRVIGRNGWQVTLPGLGSTLLQIGIGVADLAFVSLAMYALVSAYTPIDFPSAMVAYVLSALLGFASHSPGSMGVFDAAMLLTLSDLPKEKLIASLLIFRFLYFLLPFALAMAFFMARELWARGRRTALAAPAVEIRSGGSCR